jgi:toxin FitB
VTIPSDSDRYVVDSTGWVEYLGNGPKVDRFVTYFETEITLLLPSIVVYEVHKKLSREQGSILGMEFLSQAYAFGDRLIPLTLDLAILASQTSKETGLPMADAIIYATAHHYKAQVVTSDSHFANLPGVTLI